MTWQTPTTHPWPAVTYYVQASSLAVTCTPTAQCSQPPLDPEVMSKGEACSNFAHAIITPSSRSPLHKPTTACVPHTFSQHSSSSQTVQNTLFRAHQLINIRACHTTGIDFVQCSKEGQIYCSHRRHKRAAAAAQAWPTDRLHCCRETVHGNQLCHKHEPSIKTQSGSNLKAERPGVPLQQYSPATVSPTPAKHTPQACWPVTRLMRKQ